MYPVSHEEYRLIFLRTYIGKTFNDRDVNTRSTEINLEYGTFYTMVFASFSANWSRESATNGIIKSEL